MRRAKLGWMLGIWAIVVVLTSSTVVTSKQFVRLAAQGPLQVSEREFDSFWRKWWWLFVKGYHVLEFFLFTLLLGLFLHLQRGLTVRRSLVWAAIGGIAFAASDEWHQTFVPGRGGLVGDVLIDLVGVALAVGVLAVLWRRAETPGAGGP
ncbi:MAG: VanZ family protein [Armatimonadota bacterium]